MPRQSPFSRSCRGGYTPCQRTHVCLQHRGLLPHSSPLMALAMAVLHARVRYFPGLVELHKRVRYRIVKHKPHLNTHQPPPNHSTHLLKTPPQLRPWQPTSTLHRRQSGLRYTNPRVPGPSLLPFVSLLHFWYGQHTNAIQLSRRIKK